MPDGRDRVDHGAAVADRRAKGLRFGQGRELLARAGGGRAAPGGDKVGGVFEAEFFVGCQDFMAVSVASQWLQTAHGVKREQLLSH